MKVGRGSGNGGGARGRSWVGDVDHREQGLPRTDPVFEEREDAVASLHTPKTLRGGARQAGKRAGRGGRGDPHSSG